MASRYEEMSDYRKIYNGVIDLYEALDFQGALDLAEIRLEDDELPIYYRIKLLLVQTAAVEDWLEGVAIWKEAEKVWIGQRRLHTIGENAQMESVLQELRDDIDAAKAHHLTEDTSGASSRVWDQDDEEVEDEEMEDEKMADEEMEGYA